MTTIPRPSPEVVASLVKKLEDAGRTGLAEMTKLFYPDPEDFDAGMLPGIRVDMVEFKDFRFYYGPFVLDGTISLWEREGGSSMADFFFQLAQPPEINQFDPFIVFVFDQLCLDAALRFRGGDGLGIDSNPYIQQTAY